MLRIFCALFFVWLCLMLVAVQAPSQAAIGSLVCARGAFVTINNLADRTTASCELLKVKRVGKVRPRKVAKVKAV